MGWLGDTTSTSIRRNGKPRSRSCSGGIMEMVRLMRSSRSMSVYRLSRKMLLSAWPAICAREGYVLDRARGVSAAACRPVPTIMTRSAPRCRAGLTGAICRMEPSPKYSRLMRTAGKMKGSADDAIKCSTRSDVAQPMRWLRSQASHPGPP